MATTPIAPPVPSPLWGSNYGPVTPQPPVLLATPQQLTANAAAFASIFIQPVNSIMIWLNLVGFSASDQAALRFNNDSGTNYWDRNLTVVAGGVVVVDTNSAGALAFMRLGVAGTLPTTMLITVTNPSATAAKTKVVRTSISQATGAAGTAGTGFIWGGGEWVNTSTPISRIDCLVVGANNFLAGSSIMVWGGA